MGRIACYRDSDEDGKLDRFHIPGTAYGKWFKVEDPIPYKEAVDLDASEGYRRELLYQGIAGDVVRLAYREYVDSLVRPAYEQEVTYTLESGPTEVAFRGATLRIISASNLAIVYEVLSGFRE
jgi:hypothetical protein